MTCMKSIPWKYADINFVKSWTWKTAHFTASVRSDGERFFYIVLDRLQGAERSIASGDAETFQEAEYFIKESIGKSYATRLGYQSYTGAAATTFHIYTGEEVDLHEFDGALVILDVIGKNQVAQSFTGTLRLEGHDIYLFPDSTTRVKVPASFIYSIRKGDGRGVGSLQGKITGNTTRDIVHVAKKPASRTVPGKKVVGCTGVDGFNVGTVSHPPGTPWCSIHKV